MATATATASAIAKARDIAMAMYYPVRLTLPKTTNSKPSAKNSFEIDGRGYQKCKELQLQNHENTEFQKFKNPILEDCGFCPKSLGQGPWPKGSWPRILAKGLGQGSCPGILPRDLGKGFCWPRILAKGLSQGSCRRNLGQRF